MKADIYEKCPKKHICVKKNDVENEKMFNYLQFCL